MLEMDEPTHRSHDRESAPSEDDQAGRAPKDRSESGTSRPDSPDLQETPLPEELTGRASKTDEDLTALFENETPDHLVDGFRGASGDDPDDVDVEDSESPND
ncbi:MAG: hypothetical protein ABI647_06565 [Gemmatimonadota bacterium]